MKIIKLPSVLPSDLDLQAVNQQLHERAAQLDWSAVVSAAEQHLAVLLAGLNDANDAEVLGINDGAIADRIAADVAKVLQQQKPKTKKPRSKSKQVSKNTPQTWQQSSLLETQFVASEKQGVEGQGSLIETRFVPSAQAEGQEQPQVSAANADTKTPAPANFSTLKPPTPYQIRAELEQAVLNDLLGPAGGPEEEVDEDSVSDRYLVGLLAPQYRQLSAQEQPEQQDELAIADKGNLEEGNTEGSVPPTGATMFPSSFGMTFCVNGSAKALEITAGWGSYKREGSQISFKEDGTPRKVWKRYPMQGVTTMQLIEAQEINTIVLPNECPDVYVRGQVRRQNDGDWVVTLFLVNSQHEPKTNRDAAWLFQPQLSVRAPSLSSPDIFIRKPLPASTQNLDPVIAAEDRAIAMLYRHQVEFAVGHGVSVCAETAPQTRERAVCLSTSVVPAYEVPKTTPPLIDEIPQLAGLVLDMKELATVNTEDFSTLLNPLTSAYALWIAHEQQRIDDPAAGLAEYHAAATMAIANSERTLERIRAGVELLQTDEKAATAFRFMNRAMWLSRIHSLYAEQQRRGEAADLAEIDLPKNRTWYPFQLAFILLNLPSLTDLHHPERSHPTEAVADLLWFPTGGGKTEAYLGLTAYTIGLRRLQGVVAGRSGESGVAVLMRYTLRLLTLQQFQRATTLICACESIRREDETKWGKEPFRIGLWVGQRTTPNYTSQSEEFTKQSRGQYQQYSGGSPQQLTNCPWCGTKINPGQHIQVESVEKGQGRTFIRCGDALGRCLFSKGEGLPILVVDEEIYRRLPALLIATVDKFAQMPWRGEIQMLFGQVSGYCERHGFRSPDIDDKDRHNKTGNLPAAKTITHPLLRPPDLIIQDELHLISGPLGTLVGLYETAIDELATWEVNGQRVRPKVIASTATIKQAQAQVHNLFLRRVQVFPPQGLDVADNFFSRQRPPSEQHPGRRYLGICAPGRRLKAAIIRVYVALLAASQSLYEQYGQHADPWMTLVGYFNSVRELGGTRRLVEDDIRSRLAKMDQRGLAKRSRLMMDELTSRKDSTEIPTILDWLETSFDPTQEAENQTRRQTQQRVEKRDPLDVLLATNMISVGVDVKRLGAMVVAGQPKNTAEYIQATSRVGRTYPGLVITVYNWARPRDLSHYERFAHYHATFYQNVEALSVTPFAPGALYRGLAALLVSLVRQKGQEFNKSLSAGLIGRNHPYVRAAIETIVQRSGLIGNAKTSQYVQQELEAKLDRWLNRAQALVGGSTLKYVADKKDGITLELLNVAGRGEWQDFTCLNSLRNVEPTVGLILQDRVPDEDFSRLPQPMTEENQ